MPAVEAAMLPRPGKIGQPPMGLRAAAVGSLCQKPWRMVRAVAAAALAFTICQTAGREAVGEARAEGTLPDRLVYLRDVDPSITQDMRYAGSNNFVGRPLDGYDAGECILRRDVAVALARVQMDLAGSGLALKVYDCYRPLRAVRTMAQWANDGRSGGSTKRFYPRLQKGVLFELGYIASHSAHSTGNTVDLTLVQVPPPPTAAFDPAASYGPCTGPAAQRSPDTSIDMGVGYDCFDAVSSTASPGITAEQRRRRYQLVAAMAKRGFANYHREWWHFSHGSRGPSYDVPIRPRAAKAP
jgi:D-alanyl-D-alanine dipeptidase